MPAGAPTADRSAVAILCGGVLLVALWSAGLAAQRPAAPSTIRFVRSDVEAALPQSSIYAMLQDRDGYLWFGTREGLARWDGYEVRTWRMQPFGGGALPDNIVRRLLQDRRGDIYVVTVPDDVQEPHVSRLVAPGFLVVETFPERGAVPFLDRQGDPWLAGRDSIYPVQDGTKPRPPAVARLQRGVAATDALVDRHARLWVSTLAGPLERFDATRRTGMLVNGAPTLRLENRFGRLFEDAAGTIWVTGRGLHRVDPAVDRVTSAPIESVLPDSTPTTDLLQDPDGWLWVASLVGVLRFDPAMLSVQRHSMRLAGGISTQNYVTSLMRDRAGAIWAGTIWGLHRHDPAAKPFAFLAHDPNLSNTIGSGLVLSLLEDETDALWVGTLGGGINRLDPRSGEVRRFRSGIGSWSDPGDDWIWSIADAGKGKIWIGTARGLGLLDPTRRPALQVLPLPGMPPTPISGVYALLADGGGGVWIARGGTLMRRTADGRVTTLPVEITGMIHTLRAHGPLLWIGTTVGLLRYDTVTGATRWFRHDAGDTTSVSDDLIVSLHLATDGALWVGTQNGLNRLASDASDFEHFDEDPPVAGTLIQSILESSDRHLWLGTNRGLVRFDPAGPPGRRTRRFGPTSGIGNLEFNRTAAWQGRDGTFFFGGDQGVTQFHPDDLRDNPFVPPVVLTTVARARRAGTVTTRHQAPQDTVVLTPEDVTVTFTFAALDFSNPALNHYAWRLEGFDPRWSLPGTARSATYTNLPPGMYTLRVRGSNDDGRWNETGLAVPVLVEPAYWETVWFRAGLFGLALLLASGATAVVQRGRHRRAVQAMAYHQALAAERARISRDMHDEIGAGITEIAMLSEFALRRDDAGTTRAAPWQAIAERARSLIGTIGEIIWAITPEHDAADRLAPYLREYASDFLEAAGLRGELHFDLAAWPGTLHPDFRRNLLLVLKEALTNVARHAGASVVRVRLLATAEALTLVVQDDGRGIVPDARVAAEERGHRGLANLARRAALLGGTLDLSSGSGTGTTVTLHIPADRERRWPSA